MSPSEIAKRIQHTLIMTQSTRDEVIRHCELCVELGFHAAMVSAQWVPLARSIVAGSAVRVASAVDFPITMMTNDGKRYEATRIVEAGAEELDMGVRIGALLAGDLEAFADDIRGVVDAVAPAPVKVMLELPLLPDELRGTAVDLAAEAGARYVKNASSGSVGTAEPGDIRFLRERAPKRVGVKASGGINTLDQVLALIDAGADLIGTSSGAAIMAEALGGRRGLRTDAVPAGY